MAYKYKKKKAQKEDNSDEFEDYMLKEWYWIRTENWISENPARWYSTQEEIINWFKKFLNRK